MSPPCCQTGRHIFCEVNAASLSRNYPNVQNLAVASTIWLNRTARGEVHGSGSWLHQATGSFLLTLDFDKLHRLRQIFEAARDIGFAKPRCVPPISFDVCALPMHTGCMERTYVMSDPSNALSPILNA
jgi:hypothetical protein